jgi:dipeptidase E
MKNLLIASTSTLHGEEYLAYLKEEIKALFHGIQEIIFIPFARPSGISHDAYTQKASNFFEQIGIQVQGLHTFENPKLALQNAQGIFTGGGNTFLLVKQLHELQLMIPLKNIILNGTPYLGTSAGSNICGLSMQTTNDMPIVYPPSFQTLGCVPFNLNPHYQDPIPGKHMGETRETRIKEFHAFNTPPVIGLREGNWIEVKGNQIFLRGTEKTRVFKQGKEAIELEPNTDISTLK